MWQNMFDLDLSVLEKILRPVAVYFFLMIGLRLAGKRELAQLNAMDLIVLLTISNTVQNAIIGNDNTVVGGLIGAATLLLLNYSIVRFLYNHDKIDRIVEGAPTVLVENGHLQFDNMRHELLTQSELEIAAHKQGFGSLVEVDRAVLEAGGVISFVGRKPAPDEKRFVELAHRLDHISQQLSTVQTQLAARG